MRFLVRLAFWLGLVVLLSPAAPPQETAPARQIGATTTLMPAREAEPATRRPSRDTLTLADVAVPWRGPPGRDTGSRSSR